MDSLLLVASVCGSDKIAKGLRSCVPPFHNGWTVVPEPGQDDLEDKTHDSASLCASGEQKAEVSPARPEHIGEAQSVEEEILLLRREVATSQKFLDYMTAGSLISCMFLLYRCVLPVGLWMFGAAVSVGFVVGSATAFVLGAVDSYGMMALLLNVFVLVPCNVTYFVLFYPTLPLRMLAYQCFQFAVIPVITKGKTHVSFWEADFAAFLKILPDAYNLILPTDPALKPFDSIDDATQEQARTALTNSAFLRFLKEWSAAHIPKTVLNALGFRLAFCVISVPTLGWWLCGPCRIPLLPIRGAAGEKSKADSEGSAQTVGGRSASDASASRAADPIGKPPMTLSFKKCRMLDVATSRFGEAVGKQKCLNE
eukprot:TRINITY_DN12661_c0_g1_i2.p1 TRINITY_DN12661_c0_g1~~TRINITY_DN12661_c0_g1_i2.p1  ORF type:complete len:368 (-),score=62.10 TRINITY_DN12661_c0_g1_i2:264-1367(-)